MTGLALALLLACPGRASEFLEALHRAEARDARDPERVEFAGRAIRAWRPSDGDALLADAHFRRAEGELSALDDAAAEADLAKAASLDPRHEKSRLLLAGARLRLGRAAEAEGGFAACAQERPDDGEAWLGLAEARLARGLPRADKPALAAAAEAARLLGSDDPRPPLIQGRAHLAAGRPLKALEALDAAAEKAGAGLLPEALSWRARAKAELGDARGARADGGRAAEGYERRLEDLRRANAPEAAAAAARAALSDVRFRRGEAEERLSLPAEALEDFRAACELGLPRACAKAAAAPKPAPTPSPARRRFKSNPASDPGTRIYAN